MRMTQKDKAKRGMGSRPCNLVSKNTFFLLHDGCKSAKMSGYASIEKYYIQTVKEPVAAA